MSVALPYKHEWSVLLSFVFLATAQTKIKYTHLHYTCQMCYNPTMQIPIYYTLAEVAKQLRVSGATVKRWIKNGQMPAIKINSRGDYRISHDQLQQYLNDKTV